MAQVTGLVLITACATLALPASLATLAARQDVRGRTPHTQTAQGSTTEETARAVALAEALAKAPTDDDRKRLLEDGRDAWGTELSRALFQRSIALRQAQRYDEAMAALDLLSSVANHTGHRLGFAWAENGKGTIVNIRGDVLGGLAHFQRASEIAEEANDTLTLIAAVNNAGKAYENLGELELARESGRRMLSLAEKSGNVNLTAHAHAALGQTLARLDEYREARIHLERALALSNEQRYVTGIILAVEGLQILHTLQGDFDRALEMAERLRAMDGGAHTGAMNTGLVHVARGDYSSAIRDFEQALVPLANAPLSLGPLLYRLGQACLLAGRLDDAARYALQGLDVAERAGHRLGVVNALNVLADVRLERDDPRRALEAAMRAADMAAAMGGARMELTARVTAGRAQRALGRPDEARRSFEAAVALAETIRGRVGGDELDRQRIFEQIVAPYQELVALLAEAGQPWEALTYAERAKGRVLLDVLSTEAHVDLERVLSTAERIEERRLRLAHAAANVDLVRAREKADANATEVAEVAALATRTAEARRAHDTYRASLLAKHPRLQARIGNLAPLTRDDLAALVPDARTALVEFVVQRDRTHVFVAYGASSQIKVETFTVPIARAALIKQVNDYRAALAARALGTKQSGRALHDLLLKSVRERLEARVLKSSGVNARNVKAGGAKAIDSAPLAAQAVDARAGGAKAVAAKAAPAEADVHTKLVIVPDDVLWELPFHTLVGVNDRYVLEDAAVAYAPSFTTLREMAALARRRANQPAAVEILAVGDPSPAEGPPVPHAAREVNALASIYGASRSRVFVGVRADEARFWQQAGSARRIHVAAHGVLDSRAPLQSYVALAPGTAGDDGLLEARELMRRSLRAEVLVLSACETARGRARAGEGLIGLGWAAFMAGSASTVVSQWKVDSRSTADLMIAFHRALQPDAAGRRLGTADALRRAALTTARTPAYAHPFYWAGFVVMGDPR